MFAGKKSAQIREILISESAWEEMTCLFAPSLANGENVPFGAMATVKDSKDSPGYIVGDNGQVYLTGLDAQGSLLIKWGNGSNEQCQASYSIPDSHAAVTILTELCR